METRGRPAADAEWLRHAAGMVVEYELTGRTWPASVEQFQRDTGREVPAVVRRAARDVTRAAPRLEPADLAALLRSWAADLERGRRPPWTGGLL